ncbi:MAG TPA: group 1 truncated hemoglobin [Bryobacteraceae bacterium]|nr:group 1 truncated hemoglobin [Bryobacteraceae bacterium]
MLDPQKSLYHRLGGYDAIAAFADDLLPRLLADPQLGIYWKGKCRDSLRKERQILVDYLCAATGGPVNYSGRDMKTSHEGLGISESDWDLFAKHAVASLEDLGVPQSEKNEVLALAASLRADIVEAGQASGAIV